MLDLIKEVLSLDEEIQKLATELYQQKSVLIMGRGYHYATCLEGALVSECSCLSKRLSLNFFLLMRVLLKLLLFYKSEMSQEVLKGFIKVIPDCKKYFTFLKL